MKKERARLWEQLDSVLKEMEPLKKKERSIRSKIKQIQAALFIVDQKRSIEKVKQKIEALESFSPPKDATELKARLEWLEGSINNE